MLGDTLELVKRVNRFRGLTVMQIMQMYGLAEGSYEGCTRRLAHLANTEQLLEQKRIPHQTKLRGSPSLVYVVGNEGINLLKRKGEDFKRPKFERGTVISEHNWHSIDVNTICITAHRWAETTPGVEIRGMMTDFDFDEDKRFPYPMTDDNGMKHKVKMDGLLGIKREAHVGKDKQFLLELEEGSNEPAKLREKVRRLVLFLAHYEKVFGTRLFSGYLFFATASYGIKQGKKRYPSAEDHRNIVLREIATQLRLMNCQEYAASFRVTSCPIGSSGLFTDSVWYHPGDYDPYRLFVDQVS